MKINANPVPALLREFYNAAANRCARFTADPFEKSTLAGRVCKTLLTPLDIAICVFHTVVKVVSPTYASIASKAITSYKIRPQLFTAYNLYEIFGQEYLKAKIELKELREAIQATRLREDPVEEPERAVRFEIPQPKKANSNYSPLKILLAAGSVGIGICLQQTLSKQ